MILLSHKPKLLMSLDKRIHDPTRKTWETWYRLRACAHDGHIVWQGWTQDREDADEFLRCISIGHIPPSERDYFIPTWPSHLEDLPLSYHFATVTFLTATSATNWPVPADWNNAINTCEVIGGGGGGGGGNSAVVPGSGGGAGAYSSVSNLASSGANFKYLAGAAGPAGAAQFDGTAGADSWFSNTTVAPTTTSEGTLAKGGSKGLTSGVVANGGASASGIGTTKNSGGNSATVGGGAVIASGGGGAAYSSGAGNNGSAATGNGGAGAGSGGGTAGAGGAVPTAGGNGTNWDASHGTGGGGGGSDGQAGSNPGAAGGNYGGAGGGGGQDNCATSFAGGAGKQGIVIITYTSFPFLPTISLPDFLSRKIVMVGY